MPEVTAGALVFSLVRIVVLSGLMLGSGWLVAALALGARRDNRPDGGDDGLDRLAIALGWGFGVLPAFAFYSNLALGWRITSWVVVTAGLCNAMLAWGLLRGAHPKLGAAALIDKIRPRFSRAEWAVVGSGLAIALLYFIKHDNRYTFPTSCIYWTADMVTAATPRETTPLLTHNVQGARLGNTAVLAGFIGLYGPAGLRLVHALCGLLVGLGGFLVGRWVGKSFGWGVVGGLIAALNPYVLAFPLVDENLLTLAYTAAVIPLVTLNRGAFTGGVLFALVVTMRHILFPGVLAMLLAARGKWLRFGLAFVLMTIPENLHHILALGSIFYIESYTDFHPVPHTLLGQPFEWMGFLNFPFHSEIVRTPHNAYPTFVNWPLYLADHLGVVLFSALLLGFFVIWRRDRYQALFFALWSWVVMAILAVQESWDHLNKMGIIIIVFSAFIAWIVAGLDFARRRPMLGVPVLLALSLGTFACVDAVRTWRPPLDQRYYDYQDPSLEVKSLVDDTRARDTDIGWLPDMGRLHRWGRFIDRDKWVDIPANLAASDFAELRSPYMWFVHETPPKGVPVTIELDLSEDPYHRRVIARLSEEPAEIDLTEPTGVIKVKGMRAPWSPREIAVHATRNETVTALQIYFGPEPTSEPLLEDQQGMLDSVVGGIAKPDERFIEGHTSPKLRVRLPAGALNIGMEININAERIFLWKAVVTPEKLEITGPLEPWHN